MLNGVSLIHAVQKGKHTMHKALLNNTSNAVKDNDLKEHPLYEIVPKEYHK
jgi:hypothetical protein